MLRIRLGMLAGALTLALAAAPTVFAQNGTCPYAGCKKAKGCCAPHTASTVADFSAWESEGTFEVVREGALPVDAMVRSLR